MDNLSKRISYEKFLDRFELYWDNDVVSMTIDECKKLIPILQEFVR